LQEEIFKTERGLELLLEATGELLQQVDQAPEGVMRSLKDWLAALEDWLWEISSGEDRRRLAEAGEVLQQQVKTCLAERQSSEWMRQTLRIGVAARAVPVSRRSTGARNRLDRRSFEGCLDLTGSDRSR
jgi:vacuolar-type H+-ATPase subunit E/Vma4